MKKIIGLLLIAFSCGAFANLSDIVVEENPTIDGFPISYSATSIQDVCEYLGYERYIPGGFVISDSEDEIRSVNINSAGKVTNMYAGATVISKVLCADPTGQKGGRIKISAYGEEELVYGTTNINFSYSTNYIGTCRVLGHNNYVNGSQSYIGVSNEILVLVNDEGTLTSSSAKAEDNLLSELVCVSYGEFEEDLN